LEDFELIAAGFFDDVFAARFVKLAKFAAFAGCRGDRDDESNCHGISLVRLYVARDLINPG
jgi:hypothetical protein